MTISGHGLKRRATEALDAEKRVQLSKLKSDAIVDFLTKLPVITHRAFLVEHTEKGFILNGQKDEISRKLPDLYGLIGTKRRKWNLPGVVNNNRSEDRDAYDREQYEMHKTHFRVLFERFYLPMYVNGHIDEALYDQYGDDYPLDTNSSGEEVPKHQQISQENRQRAKIPSNPKQRQLRQELLEHRKFERDRIARKHYDEEQKLFCMNKECEDLILKQVSSLSEAQDSHFGKAKSAGVHPSPDQIKAFIKVRLERTLTLKNMPKYQAATGTRQVLKEQALLLKDVKPVEPYLEEPLGTPL